MFSTIKEAWGEDFVDNKPIFKQSNISEHFKPLELPVNANNGNTNSVCPCCNRSYESDSNSPINVLKKKENKEFIQAFLIGLLIILLLHLFN